MYDKKMPVLRITAKRTKTGEGIKRESGAVLEGKDIYELTKNPFFKFIYEEIQKLRGEQNEKI